LTQSVTKIASKTFYTEIKELNKTTESSSADTEVASNLPTVHRTLFKLSEEQSISDSSIELDIWMTKDNKLVIIHGGDNGEMPVPVDQKENPDYVKQYIFDLTYEELQNLFTKSSSYLDSDKTQDCLVPEMHELFSLVNNHTNHSNHFRSKQIV